MTAAVAACKPGSELLRLTGQTMGTTWNIVAVDHDRAVEARALADRVETALADVTRAMSNWDAGSELSRINAAPAGEVLTLSPQMAHVLAAAADVHRASAGRFDVTAGALIDLWGFGAGHAGHRVPAEAEIAALRDLLVGQDRLLNLDGASLTKGASETSIYLSAIAKGYGVDSVAQVLRAAGLRDFMIEIGGDLYAEGRNGNGQPWQIGVEVPRAGVAGVHRVIPVTGLGMATSGDYRNFFDANGQRYSHIIDPTTGRPITHDTVSATVLDADAMRADAWATAMLVLGRARGTEIADALGLPVLFIETTDAGLATSQTRALSALIG
jgi:thiamine biosynthesis lipoprotein